MREEGIGGGVSGRKLNIGEFARLSSYGCRSASTGFKAQPLPRASAPIVVFGRQRPRMARDSDD